MDNLEFKIAQSLFNHQRRKILKAIREDAKTVKAIAGELHEKPSRLYYHINQLEELGLIEVAEEKKVKNLIQKYYRSVNYDELFKEYTFSKNMIEKDPDFVTSQLYSYTDEAILRIKNDLQPEVTKPKSEASLMNVKLTENEWQEVNKKVRSLLQDRKSKSGGQSDEEIYDANYILLTYLD